jgi:chorismate mutase
MLDLLRTQIDHIDQQILSLLEQRRKVSDTIQALKRNQQGSIYQPLREHCVLSRIPLHLRNIFRLIVAQSRAVHGKIHVIGEADTQSLCERWFQSEYMLCITPFNIPVPEAPKTLYFWHHQEKGVDTALDSGLFPILWDGPYILFTFSTQSYSPCDHAYEAWWHPGSVQAHPEAVKLQKTCRSGCFTLTYPKRNSGLNLQYFRGWVYLAA